MEAHGGLRRGPSIFQTNECKTFVILVAVGLTFIILWNMPINSPYAIGLNEAESWEATFQLAEFEPNGTLLVDGVTMTFENEDIVQAGSIVVTNGGRLIIRNSQVRFSQLAPYQYGVTIEKTSELIVEASSFSTKYPASWFIDSSNVTLIAASAAQCFLRAEGVSTVTINESKVSGITLTDACSLTAINSDIGEAGMDSCASATLSNTDAASIHMADSAYIGADSLSCEQLIISDDSWCTITSLNSGELHLWGQSEASITGGSVHDLGLYDSTSVAISDCTVGYFVVRSSLFQILDSLTIDELVCIHYSQLQVTNCIVKSLTATGHANLSIINCDLGDVLLTEWSSGQMKETNASSTMITMYSSWSLSGINSDYLECSREALVYISDSSIYDLYAWNFNLTSWSYANFLNITDSFVHRLGMGWWTMPIIDNCVIEESTLYHHIIFSIIHTNFTTSLLLQNDVTGSFSFCNIARLYTRHIVNVTLKSSILEWMVEPDVDTHSITNLPFGNFTFWNPLTNASFDAISYNITMIDCMMENLRISIGRGITCDVTHSSFSWAIVYDMGEGYFNDCNFIDLTCYGVVIMRNCTVVYANAGYSSNGYAEDCNIGTMNIYDSSNWLIKNSIASYLGVGGWGGSFLRLETSNSTSLWVSGSGAAELEGCDVWQIRTYNQIHITATNCIVNTWYNAFTDYPTATAVNCTLGTITAIAHTTLTLLNCDIDYFGTRDYASTLAENCSFYQFSATNWAQVTLQGDFSWTQSFSIADSAIVYRVFDIHTVFVNGTSCPLTEYVVLSAANITLHSGTTSLQGIADFTMVFTRSNIAEFYDMYAISVDMPLLFGWHPFDVRSNQPMQILVEETPPPPPLDSPAIPEDSEEISQTISGEEEENKSPIQEKRQIVITEESNTLVVLGFLAGSGMCVSAAITVMHLPSFKITSKRRSNHEEK